MSLSAPHASRANARIYASFQRVNAGGSDIEKR
jgi:hypothetical protein